MEAFIGIAVAMSGGVSKFAFSTERKGIEAFVPITTHSHPLTPCTLSQLVVTSFFVSLLVLEIGLLKHSFELPLQ